MNAVYGYGGWGGRLIDGVKKVRGLSTRRPVWKLPRIKPDKKVMYKLHGGPFDGEVLPLTDGTTMKFRVRRKTSQGMVTLSGCYRCGLVGVARRFDGTASWVPSCEVQS